MRKKLLVICLILILGIIPLSHLFLERGSLLESTSMLPGRSMSLSEQQAQAVAGLIVKPVYMLVSFAVILALSGQKRNDIIALRWGQIAFLIGEVFCAVNFYIFRHTSILSEYLHSYGMVLAFGFTTYAVLEGWDARFSRRIPARMVPRVAGLFKFILPLFAVLSFIPLLSPLQPDAYGVTVFGFDYSYTRFDFFLLYERRMLPWLAIFAFSCAWLIFIIKDQLPLSEIVKIFISIGAGAIGFSFFRVTLNAVFVNRLVWFEFWEETTELMFVSGVAFMLWNFRELALRWTPLTVSVGDFFKSLRS